MKEIKYRFYDKVVKKMYYPTPEEMGKAVEISILSDDIISMQATGIYDATKFKELDPLSQEKWLKDHTKEEWKGFEIYEGDVTALRYDKERTDYGVVSYFLGGYQKNGTALSSYQKLTKVVGNIFQGYPEKAQYAVNSYYDIFGDEEDD